MSRTSQETNLALQDVMPTYMTIRSEQNNSNQQLTLVFVLYVGLHEAYNQLKINSTQLEYSKN